MGPWGEIIDFVSLGALSGPKAPDTNSVRSGRGLLWYSDIGNQFRCGTCIGLLGFKFDIGVLF